MRVGTNVAVSQRQIDLTVAKSPPGWLALFNACVVRREGAAVWIDTTRPEWRQAVELRGGKWEPAPGREGVPRDMAKRGPPLWAELHRFCLTLDARDRAKLAAHLEALRARLPCGECRVGLAGYRRQNPPDERDPFAWSVALHNHVNRKLGKPEMTVEQARERWASSQAAGPTIA